MRRSSAALRTKSRPHRYVPWVVLFATLIATTVAWFIASRLDTEGDKYKFLGLQAGFERLLSDHLNSQGQLGKSVAAFMGAFPNATKSDFEKFLKDQGWPKKTEDVGIVSFGMHVPPGGGKAFETYAAAHGVAPVDVDFERDSLDRVLSLYRLPVEPGMQPPGFDTTGIASRRAAIEQARDDGDISATGPVHLLQDKDQRATSVVAFAPVYLGPTPGNIEERRKNIFGYAGVSIRLSKVIEEIADHNSVFITIQSEPEGEPLFSNLPSGYKYRFHKRDEITAFDRKWVCEFYSTPELEASSADDISIFILVVGATFAVIFFFLTNSQLGAQKDLASYAEEIERLASAESLLAQAGSLFSSTDDFKVVLNQIGQSAVPMLADLCSVDVLEHGEIMEVALYGADESETREARGVSDAALITLQDDYGIGKALRTGRSELVTGLGRELSAELNLPSQVSDYLERRGFTSAMFVPVTIRGAVLGSLSFFTGPEKRPFSPSDLRQMEEVAERIGLAIDNSRLFVAAQQELAEKVKAEEALRSLNEELEQMVSDRTRELTIAVDELEAFCYSVSHDLRAPLRSVDGFSKALIEDYQGQLDNDGLDYLNRIRRAALRMDELITALLTLSRLTRAEITPADVDVTAVVHEIVADHSESGRCEFVIQKNMTTHADPHMVRVLFENLISNAIKFSGKVEFPHIRIGEKDGVFFVRDNGAGFDPRYSSKLFQPFERLHTAAEFPGSGIGLATVSRIVRRHGGRIWAESELGKGAAFFFTFAPDED